MSGPGPWPKAMGRGALPVGRAAGPGPAARGWSSRGWWSSRRLCTWWWLAGLVGAGLLEVLLPLSGVASAQQPRLSATGGSRRCPNLPRLLLTDHFWSTGLPGRCSFRFGLSFESGDRHCTKVHATLPFPTNWPEQGDDGGRCAGSCQLPVPVSSVCGWDLAACSRLCGRATAQRVQNRGGPGCGEIFHSAGWTDR
jgi:hypothetical protein